MRLLALQPMLRTKDLMATVEFYQEMLDFSCDGLDLEEGWASLSRDQVSLMVASPNAQMPFDKPLFTGSLYFYLDDVDELWASISSRVEVCYPIEDFDYGMREFAIFDNNGYLLQFGAEIATTEVDVR